ncbi:tol-pal system-associated acyl-CoA thioesterase [Vibrio sp. SCSIO 43137]|uniref:tol-pal system-associated acyl-CoA thioesterase n=1 Tax=Vibrio sp. SCSIO 43137 TaxID=3021011 RepID=UPI002307D84D|nr:tol-pal system-associated acyl-CoA thioesterase [Vibrio sp. SCSIO 43137]WCE30722.1 tol-pal system-associated acyl-CoA thioesterase [Vibrio sp. SCSIO 43137]
MEQAIAPQFRWPVTVYYEDTDAGGVVYHSNYLKYFERARTELLRSVGVSQQVLLEQQTGFVVRHMDIDFLLGAKLDEHLTVVTTIAELKKASISFCQEMVNHQGDVLCRATVKVACVNSLKMKPKAIPGSIIAELKSE